MTARILVADDEPSIRWLLERLLRQAGHTVTVVEDGETALARASTEAFDLAFLDVRMPGLDGLEVLSRLRTDAPETAVIVMTAHGSVRSAVDSGTFSRPRMTLRCSWSWWRSSSSLMRRS